MPTSRKRTDLCLSVVVALAITLTLVPLAASAVPGKTVGGEVRLQLLAINDFHGQIIPYSTAFGSVANLAGYLNAREAQAKRTNTTTWRLGVGDLIGASPAQSALLQDEPTMQVLDEMGFKFSPVGNHEFDEGLAELKRLQYGGYSEITGDWGGTSMQYLAANVVYAGTDDTIFPAYAIARVNGVKVGVIGVVTAETPTIVTASGVAGLEFLDPATAANKAVGELKARGVEAIIVLAHEGGYGTVTGGPITGNIVPLVTALDDEVDVVLSAHSHQRYWGTIDGKLVTQAHSAGRAFADVDLVIDRATGDVVSKSAEIVATTPTDTIVPDPAVQAIVDEASATVAPVVNAVVAQAGQDMLTVQNTAGESVLGDLIADGQRWKMGTQIAFMNPGGIRTNLYAGEVTYGELFAIQPFGNYMVSMNMTGAQIDAVLEQQWRTTPTGVAQTILQISGISYAWNPGGAVGSRIDPASIMVNGAPLDLAAVYTVTSNNFLAEGGDNFTVFRNATNKVYAGSDLDALIDYVVQLPQPFFAPAGGRILRLP